jgi:hypothetical protein
MNHEIKTEDFLFFVFQSVSRANTTNKVDMNALLLVTCTVLFHPSNLKFLSLQENNSVIRLIKLILIKSFYFAL